LALATRDKAVRDIERDIVALDRKFSEATDKISAAEKALAAARLAQGHAWAERHTRKLGFEAAFDNATRTLVETCHPAIGVFLGEMRDEYDRTRRIRVDDRSEVVINQNTGKKTRKSESNKDRIVARMAAIREAVAEAEEMRLLADQSGVPAALQKLKNELPSAD